jgi:ketosteroid isomerase-like protein
MKKSPYRLIDRPAIFPVLAWLALVVISAAVAPARSAPPSDQRDGPPGVAISPRTITRERFAEYIHRFNAQDERYADLYADDVVFEHGPYYGTLRGPQAILDFYRNTWKSFRQTLVPGDVVIDNDRGLMAAEMTTHLVARVDGVASQSHPEGMKAGDEVVSVGVVIYEIRDGRITHIRGAPQKAVFHPTGSQAAPAPLPASLEPLTPATQAQLEAAYRKYLECFNARDVPCFSNFYDEDVVFMASPLPGMLGRDAIVAFYQRIWKHLREHLVVRSLSVENGRLEVSLQNTIDVLDDYPDFPPHPLKKGQHFVRAGTISYELGAGRFIRIADGTR